MDFPLPTHQLPSEPGQKPELPPAEPGRVSPWEMTPMLTNILLQQQQQQQQQPTFEMYGNMYVCIYI